MDVAAAARAVELIRAVAGGATRPEVVAGVGGFAGLVSLGDGRFLAAGADGVGTKLDVARRLGRLDTVGVDLVAMCANDVACTGAEPLFFLDYVAVGRLVPETIAALVEGVAEGCRRAGCALLGGETAEHPGVMADDAIDLAGFCVGIAREADLLGPARVSAGDALIGFRSTGLHANGFSLVRRVLVDAGADLRSPLPALGGRTLADELLEPTAVYVRPLLALREAGLARAAAHITGGGFTENLPRMLPPGLGARIDRSAWSPPPIFGVVGEAAGLEPVDLFGVLNMGIGMVVAVGPGEVERALAVGGEAGAEAVRIGTVAEGARVDLG